LITLQQFDKLGGPWNLIPSQQPY
jgi:pyridoxine 5'-phosphate synthase PdxJ